MKLRQKFLNLLPYKWSPDLEPKSVYLQVRSKPWFLYLVLRANLRFLKLYHMIDTLTLDTGILLFRPKVYPAISYTAQIVEQ